MIRLKISGYGMERIIAMIDRASHPDLLPLAEKVAGIMEEDNRSGLLAGTDSFGDAMTPVEESTIRRGRGGDGPPTVPRHEASRFISDYRVEIIPRELGFTLIGRWPNTPFVRFHRTSTRHMVARDPVGIRPEGLGKIAVACRDFASMLI